MIWVQALSAEEQAARRDRLAKMRALLFYHERKAARMKAIKSKARPEFLLCAGFLLRAACMHNLKSWPQYYRSIAWHVSQYQDSS